jgi:uncharacterized protein YjfI (DUF2170 family)
MNIKSSAHYQREYRKRLREQGLVKKEVWILPENSRQLSFYEKKLREFIKENTEKGVEDMITNGNKWATDSLYKALSEDVLFHSGQAKIELIEGVGQALYITMAEYGDLPIFLTISGDQLVVEAVLWPVSEVKDLRAFNDAILRTQKYFPLSSISLDSVEGENDYYYMYGALSSTSILTNVVLEIETLATNVIHAAEIYGEFLTEELETA